MRTADTVCLVLGRTEKGTAPPMCYVCQTNKRPLKNEDVSDNPPEPYSAVNNWPALCKNAEVMEVKNAKDKSRGNLLLKEKIPSDPDRWKLETL